MTSSLVLGVFLAVWTSHGPYGGAVTALDSSRSNSSVLYVVNAAGVLRSDYGGATWRSAADPLGAVSALAVDPTNPEVVYVGAGFKVLESTDGGAHWRTLPLPSLVSPVAIRIDPRDPRVVYVGSACISGFTGPVNDYGVYKSSDGGESWTQVLNDCVGTLSLDPASPAD